MSAFNGVYELDDEEFQHCALCSEEHPVGVLEDGFCPGCVDEAEPSPPTTMNDALHTDGEG